MPTPSNIHISIPFPGVSGSFVAQLVADPDGLNRIFYSPVTSLSAETIATLSATAAYAFPLIDQNAGGNTVFSRSVVVDSTTGAIIATADTLPNGAAYTPTGIVIPVEGQPTKSALSTQSLAFTDALVVTLTPPAFANWAEIHVWDGSIIWTMSGLSPDEPTKTGFRAADGARVVLQSMDELNLFKFIGLAGEIGEIYVEYFTKNN